MHQLTRYIEYPSTLDPVGAIGRLKRGLRGKAGIKSLIRGFRRKGGGFTGLEEDQEVEEEEYEV